MAFGDWVLFSNWVATKREEERYDSRMDRT